ncbi:MAG: hypothetical protein GKR89_23610 [Candidatus Latescibacteria bacterium]|nr:hypothetical protein [Candidatus Latescibacterota bacterium]
MSKQLPPQPHLNHLKQQAKDLLQGHKAADPKAVQRLRSYTPKWAQWSDVALLETKISLQDAQHAIAGEYGFASWPRLVAAVAASGPDAASASTASTDAQMEFFDAVRTLQLDRVRTLLEADPALVHARIADLGAERWEGATPGDRQSNTVLHWAANPWGSKSPSHAALAQVLIDYGADVDALGYNENKGVAPPVVLAAWGGELEVLRLLLERGADPNQPGQAEAALYTAIEHTAPDAPEPNKVSILLEYGAQHDIFTAAMTGRTDLVEMQLDEYESLIDRRSLKRNRTPLEEATHYGQWQVVQRLIDLGATVPPGASAALGRIDDLRPLLDADAQAISADYSGQPLLFWATSAGQVEMIDFLLEKGADPNQDDGFGFALRHAPTPEVVDHLVRGGATPNRATHTPPPFAALVFKGRFAAAQALLGHGANPNQRDERGCTSYHWVLRVDNHDVEGCLRFLLQQGADPSIPDNNGQTPLEWAMERGNEKAVRILREATGGCKPS